MGVCSIGPCFWGTWRGHLFLRTFLFRENFTRFLREMQNSLYSGISLHRGPIREPGGLSSARIF
jgi:hypothetical protein